MAKPLVIGHHLIWTVYGTWLPNDPRGSGSCVVTNSKLKPLGDVHRGRKSVQPSSREIRDFYQKAEGQLAFEVLKLSASMIQRVGQAIGSCCIERRYTCWACAVMPDHVHVVVRKHRDTAEQITDHLRTAAKAALVEEGMVSEKHPLWSGGQGWRVFLFHPDEVRRVVSYVERNPRRIQTWSAVKPYDGWPLHAGHSERSPYARGLKAVGIYP